MDFFSKILKNLKLKRRENHILEKYIFLKKKKKKKYLGLFIGKKGILIKKIQKKYNLKIRIIYQKLYLYGEYDDIEEVKEIFKKIEYGTNIFRIYRNFIQ